MVAVVLSVWLAPVTIEINSMMDPMSCAPLAAPSADTSLWPYIDEINNWVKSSGGRDQDAYLKATMGMLDRCSVARQNREVALILTAIAGATLLLLTRPRYRENAPSTETKLPEQTSVD